MTKSFKTIVLIAGLLFGAASVWGQTTITWTSPTTNTQIDYFDQMFNDNASKWHGKNKTGSKVNPEQKTNRWSVKTSNSGGFWIVPAVAVTQIEIDALCGSTNSGAAKYGVATTISSTATPNSIAGYSISQQSDKNVWKTATITENIAANSFVYVKFPTNVYIAEIRLFTSGGPTPPPTPGQPSNDATLSDLKVDGTTISGFSANTISYTYTVASGVTTVPTVTATATSRLPLPFREARP